MREISLHILDIVQNSIAAGATRIEITAAADTVRDVLEVRIEDNGRGMSPETLATVTNPFYTTRTTRKVGLGIPMLKAAAEACEGDVKITSEVGVGTEIIAAFRLSHIDRAPYGDITSTMLSLVTANPEIDFRYEQSCDGKSFCLDTVDIRGELGEVPIHATPVIGWLKGYFEQGLAEHGSIA